MIQASGYMQKSSQRGFLTGAYIIFMLLSLGVLGGLVFMLSNNTQKINMTQTAVNSMKIADQLAEYLVTTQGKNIDADSYIELVEQWYSLEQKNPSDTNANWTEDKPGFLPRILQDPNDSASLDMRTIYGLNANKQPFRVCSKNIEIGDEEKPQVNGNNRYEEYDSGRTLEQLMNIPVFAIIDAGNNNKLDTNYCFQAFSNTPAGDDQIRLITYSELYNATNNKNRLAMMQSNGGIPVCEGTQTLELYMDNGAMKWQCKDNYLPFATADLPSCTVDQRLVMDANGMLVCKDSYKLADAIAQDISLNQVSAGICRRGYSLTALNSVGPNIPRNYNFTCTRMASFPDAGPATETVDITLPKDCDAPTDLAKFPALYRTKTGDFGCLPMPKTALGSGSCQVATTVIFDRNKLQCFNNSLNMVEAKDFCKPNENVVLQTVTNAISCEPAVNSAEWILPYSVARPNCANGDYILGSGTDYYCLSKDQFLAAVTPTSGCSIHQMVAWGENTQRFYCIQR